MKIPPPPPSREPLFLVDRCIAQARVDATKWSSGDREVGVQVKVHNTELCLFSVYIASERFAVVDSTDWILESTAGSYRKCDGIVLSRDFNGRRTRWGYSTSDSKGKKLNKAIKRERSLLDETGDRSRLGSPTDRTTHLPTSREPEGSRMSLGSRKKTREEVTICPLRST